jgi:hypothetical protein
LAPLVVTEQAALKLTLELVVLAVTAAVVQADPLVMGVLAVLHLQ